MVQSPLKPPLYAPGKEPKDVNPWHPMKEPVDLKHMGKLQEEIYELIGAAARLGQAAARCLVQGVVESHPETGKSNMEWLEEELADLLANADLCIERFKLDGLRIAGRRAMKKKKLRAWHAMA